jgi:hypothetical protein
MSVSFSRLRTLEAGHVIALLAVLLEVLWAYPWLVWIGKWGIVGWPEPPLSLGSAAALALVVEATSRFSLGRAWPMRRVRLVTLSIAIALLAALIRLELGGDYAIWNTDWISYAQERLSLVVGGLAFGMYLIWRAISIGRESLSFDDLYRKFLIGLAALAVLLALWGATSKSSEFRRVLASAGLYVVAYFFTGLLALALINLRSIRAEMLRSEGASGLFNRRWLSLLLGVILAILGVSLAVASVFSLDLARLLVHPLNVLANWLLIGFLYGVGYPLGVLAAALIYLLRFLVHLLGRGKPPEPLNPTDISGMLSDLRKGAEEQGARGIPAEALLALKWGLVAVAALLIIFVLARALFRYGKGRPEDEIEELSESLWSWQGFKQDLRAFLKRMLGWFRRRRPDRRVIVAPPAAVAEEADDERIFTVRELYQGLLWEGRSIGHPRSSSDTPFEYQNRLEESMDAGLPELQAITSAYVADRYGGIDPDRAELALLNRLWRQVRALFRSAEAKETGRSPSPPL